ncbi:MAG: hypothetical protein LBV40_07760 [Methanomicrobiales archaeon]|jgi:hypothetical protein|nr:hypothetical protein [Methanomicrobiales archaeon]
MKTSEKHPQVRWSENPSIPLYQTETQVKDLIRGFEHQSGYTDTTTSKVENLLHFIRNFGIVIENPDDVSRQLSEIITKDKGFEDILLSVCQKVKEEFNEENTFISLESCTDPDYEERDLTIYVRQTLYEDNIMNRIRKVRSHVMVDLSNSSEWIPIITDFNCPV